MKNKQRDPGLQPERTSLAWLRTHMVLFALGLLLLRISDRGDSGILQFNAILLICFSLFFSYYSQRRFTTILNFETIVGRYEVIIKKLLSLIMFVTAMGYVISLMLRLQHYFY